MLSARIDQIRKAGVIGKLQKYVCPVDVLQGYRMPHIVSDMNVQL
jgi:hypothetical protein